MSEPVAAPGLVDHDLSCIGCDYNLRTIPHDATCPECGKPVIETLHAQGLAQSPPRWLRWICAGVVAEFAACFIVLMMATRLWPWRGTWVLTMVMSLAAPLLHLVASWCLTVRGGPRWLPIGNRWTWTCRISATAVLVAYILGSFDWMQHLASFNMTTAVVAYFAVILVTCTATIARWLILQALGRRVPDPRLAKAIRMIWITWVTLLLAQNTVGWVLGMLYHRAYLIWSILQALINGVSIAATVVVLLLLSHVIHAMVTSRRATAAINAESVHRLWALGVARSALWTVVAMGLALFLSRGIGLDYGGGYYSGWLPAEAPFLATCLGWSALGVALIFVGRRQPGAEEQADGSFNPRLFGRVAAGASVGLFVAAIVASVTMDAAAGEVAWLAGLLLLASVWGTLLHLHRTLARLGAATSVRVLRGVLAGIAVWAALQVVMWMWSYRIDHMSGFETMVAVQWIVESAGMLVGVAALALMLQYRLVLLSLSPSVQE